MSELSTEINDRKQAASDYLSTKRDLWDSVERLFHGQLQDEISTGTKSQVFDPKLSTLTIERSYRVMSQLPTGKVRGINKNDKLGEKLMNLTLDKWIIPNANSQFDFLTKLRMADLYSNIYGNFFGMVDWDVRENGYIGPDLWLLNIRDVFPQVGPVSIEDSDYVIVRTWRPLSYFKSLKKSDGFINLPGIIKKLEGMTGDRQKRSADDMGKREEDQYPEEAAAHEAGLFEVLTQYEKDRWVDYCPAADEVFRDQDNPHENDELPIVCKYSIPLLDDFMGMGDFERGGSMQMTINSVWNLYLDALKISIFPPVLINKDNIASFSSLKWGAAEKWLVRNQLNNSIQPLQLSPQGIAEFNNTYRVANASLLNLFGTTDTTVTQETEAGFGKTPQALQAQAARENTRDNADRFFMEQFLTQIMTKFANLIARKQPKSLTFRLFGDDFERLKREVPDAEELFDEKSGKLTIGKGKFGSVMFDYEIVTGSTYAVDQKTQQDNLSLLLSLYQAGQTPQGNMMVADLDRDGYKFNFGELMKRMVSNSGIQDWDKILVEKTEEEKADDQIQQDVNTFQQAVGGMAGGLQQVPQMPQAPPEEMAV